MTPTDLSIIEISHIELTPNEGTTRARGTVRTPDGTYIDLEIHQQLHRESVCDVPGTVPEHIARLVRMAFTKAWHELSERAVVEGAGMNV